MDDIGAVSWGMLVEELFGVVTSGAGVASGALEIGALAFGVETGPLLVDWARTGLAKPIRASDATVIISLFMDFTPIAGLGRDPCLSYKQAIAMFGSGPEPALSGRTSGSMEIARTDLELALVLAGPEHLVGPGMGHVQLMLPIEVAQFRAEIDQVLGDQMQHDAFAL